MYIAVAVNIINIIFGYLLIFGPGLLPEFGIRGAAMALVSSQAGGACIGLYLLYRKDGLLRNTEEQKHHLRPDSRLIKEIYRTGVPAALESMFWQFSAIILSKVILAYGENSFAAYQLGIQAETVTEMPAIGFSTASTTLAARALGQKDYELKETYFNQLIRIALRISICTSLLLIVLTSPLMLFAAVGVKLSSPGPVLFRQERVGLNKKPFYMYKFRSMRVNDRQTTGWSTDNDPRKTRFGSFIRKFSIDELPQFFNVLKGDMSLVGPRPELPFFVNQFKESIPLYMVKHQVRPGITGWAQVNGFRGDTSIKGRIEHDIYYIENWTILFDIKILFMTVFRFSNSEKLR